MSTLKLFFYSLILNNFWVFSALASSDINYCDFSLAFANPQHYNICNNLPFLSPFNDSRTNLILLTDNNKIQKATFTALTSAQNKAPYLTNDIRKNILAIPFELTVYDAYLDDLAATQQAMQKKIAHQLALDRPTKHFIADVKQIYQNNPLITDKPAHSDKDDTFFTSPTLIFLKQLANTDGLTKSERLILGVARYILFNNTHADISHYLPSDPSFTAKHFINYLLGASAFYKGNYTLANKFFTEASQASQPWIKETATYMLARNFLNQGQSIAYNNWGELNLNKVDQTAVTKSRIAFNNYLTTYPKGLYADSSNALLRRVYWLQDNKMALANAYENLLENPQRHINKQSSLKNSNADLILEIDNKIFLNDKPVTALNLTQTPKLLMVYDLLKMRTNKLTLANLKAQEVDFKDTPALHNYLLANYYTYIKPDTQQVLTLLPRLEQDSELTSLQFSEQILRALALEAENKWNEAQSLWLALKPLAKQPYQASLIELGLALNFEKSEQMAKVFAKNSPITTPQLRYILLRQNSDRKLLKQLAIDDNINKTEKAYIIYILLYKELSSRQYQQFLIDSSLLVSGDVDNIKLHAIGDKNDLNLELFSNAIPSHPDYNCPSPIILANVLKLNASDARGLNCLGEFIARYRLPFINYTPNSSLNTHIKSGALGTHTPTEFGKKTYSRLEGYRQVMNDDTADEEDRAYALYKAIRCFNGIGENRCDKQKIPKSERQKWFRLLHKNYPKTPWAKQQTIYW